MKKYQLVLCLMLVAILAGFVSYSQDCGYYPVKKGTFMRYQSLDAKGKVTGTSRVTMLDVMQTGDASLFQVKAEAWDEKDKPQPSREYTMKCEKGQFTVDMQSLVDPKSLEGFKDMEISFTGTDISYPSTLSAGQVLPDANVTIGPASGGMALLKMTINITNRVIVGPESVTVPAGTFDCFKITYDVDTKFGIKVSTKATEWLNKGAGTVKTETYDKKGKLMGSRVLTELNR